jgi:hypothetical protein
MKLSRDPALIQSMVSGSQGLEGGRAVAFRIPGVDEVHQGRGGRGVDLDADDLVQYRIMGKKKRG